MATATKTREEARRRLNVRAMRETQAFYEKNKTKLGTAFLMQEAWLAGYRAGKRAR